MIGQTATRLRSVAEALQYITISMGSLKPICVTHVLCTFFTKVRILYFDSQERCEGRGWLCGPVLQLAGWRPGPSRKLLRNISVMKRRAAAGGGTVLVCCRCCFYPHHNFHCSLSLSTRAGNEDPRRFHNHGEGPYFKTPRYNYAKLV